VNATAPPERYPPIADYGMIGDGRSIALVSRNGSIDWWCLPLYDGDPVFARLVDAKRGGYFYIRPTIPFRAERRYRGTSSILETEFTTEGGTIRVVDFMPALTEAEKKQLVLPFREIVRRVHGLAGEVPIEVVVRPRPRFGHFIPEVRELFPRHFALVWDPHALHLTSSHPLEIGIGALSTRVTLRAGERLDLAIAYSAQAPANLPVLSTLDQFERWTEGFWRRWADVCTYQGPYREAVIRSALALKLLTYAPSGAIIAAPTTSLPEVIGGVRNWDYRFCWLRDAAFTIRALLSIGYHADAHAFADWLLHATHLTHPELRVVYNIYGEHRLPEHRYDDLEGYRGSRPVRTGNAAEGQFQLDVYGEVAAALALYHKTGGTFDRDGRALLRGIARAIIRRWREPDDGIWEVRSGRAQHVHSKVMAWVGLDNLIDLTRSVSLRLDVNELHATRDTIRDWVLHHGYDPAIPSFVRTPGSNKLDAALLVIPLYGFLPASDPRLARTVDAIQRRLARGELVYRYLADDGLPGREGAFVICSFWLVEALAHLGRLSEAHDLFARLLERRNDLGLLSEEIDPESGALLGNFPQAFSHIGLINAALTLAERGGAAADSSAHIR
jgi:GH15 family glucan-1,4-alpha-glucosidase